MTISSSLSVQFPACTDAVEKAGEDEQTTNTTTIATTSSSKGSAIEGESLLLPLLQGLLDAPESDQPADSGTESGEDLRSGLIAEVQGALDKLSASLRSDATEIPPERRANLLHLVTRLQAGLSTQQQQQQVPDRRNSSGGGRFARRRSRQNRHTVGVSSEELADARRLMEEITFREPPSVNITPSTSGSRLTPSASQSSILQKQNSEGSVGQQSNSSFRSVNLGYSKSPVKNAVAKPFSNSTSGTSSSVETPTDPAEALHFLFSSNEEHKLPQPEVTYTETAQVQLRPKKLTQNHRQSLSVENDKQVGDVKRPLSESVTSGVALKSVQQAVTQAARIKKLSETRADEEEDEDDETEDDEESEEEPPISVKQAQRQSDTLQPKPPEKRYEEPKRCYQQPSKKDSQDYYRPPQPKPDLILQTNPLYSQPAQNRNNKDAGVEEKYNRFSSKKMRMKRANTIDIPKPLDCYEYDDEEEEEDSDYEHQDDRRNSYLGLRCPIQVGRLNAENKVPTFQPKTESDKKFVAFLNKHNDNAANKTNLWSNKVHNWNNRFGNIRTTFEKVSQPMENVSNARNFWKSADDAVAIGPAPSRGPKISRQSARNLQDMFEQKQKQNDPRTPWTTTVNTKQNVVTGSLRLDPKGFENKTHKFSQPSPPINQFTHAPQSAFRPIQKKTSLPSADNVSIVKSAIVDAQNETPLYLYCPKPINSPSDSQSSSPIVQTKPFLQTGESRAVNKAASKFEQVAQQQIVQPILRKANKVAVPQTFQQTSHAQGKLSAPYLVKKAEQTNNLVRQLSDQYDHKKKETHSSYSSACQDLPADQRKPSFGSQPHSYVPPTRPVVSQTPKVQTQQKHHYTPQYNQPQQFIQPQSVPKQQSYKEKQEKEHDPQLISSYVYQPHKRQHNPKTQVAQQSYQVPAVQNQRVYAPAQKNAFNENRVEYERQDSTENYKEYTAPVARVMTGPVSQQAVTVRQKSPMNRDQHEMERAFDLKNTLQKTTQQKTLSSGSFKTKYEQDRASRTPSPNPRQYRNESFRSNFLPNVKRLSIESVETNENGEAIVTTRFSIPVVNVAPATPQALMPPSPEHLLSKSDSWHQICQQAQQKPPPPATKSVVKSKSLHTLAVPKLFEAGMTKEEMVQKKKTMEAFFGGSGEKSPSISKSNSRETIDKTESAKNKGSINRIKTSEKISIHRHASSGLARSRTLPDIVCPEMLDESNVDKAFEDLFRTSS